MKTFAAILLVAGIAWPQSSSAYTIFLYDSGDSLTWEGKTYPNVKRTEGDPINWVAGADSAHEEANPPPQGDLLPPVFWDSSGSVTVSFWAGAETADMETWRQNSHIEGAIDEWNDNLDSISVTYAGNNILAMDQNDGKNVIAFGDWDDFGTNIPGRTLLVVKTGSEPDVGELIDADIVLNDGDFDWPFSGTDCSASPREYDIQSIVTHELGHAIGIGHTTTNFSQFKTMHLGACCDDVTKCENNDWRSLETDDINAGKEIYGPGGNGGSDSTWVRHETGGNGTPKPVSSTTRIALPQGNRIAGAYPNPFNPSTLIEFELDRPGKVTLSVYNMAGQLITNLLQNAQLGAGFHRVAWEPGNRDVASGVYLIRLEGQDWVSTKKIGLVR